jgi:hypothetical protein
MAFTYQRGTSEKRLREPVFTCHRAHKPGGDIEKRLREPGSCIKRLITRLAINQHAIQETKSL